MTTQLQTARARKNGRLTRRDRVRCHWLGLVLTVMVLALIVLAFTDGWARRHEPSASLTYLGLACVLGAAALPLLTA